MNTTREVKKAKNRWTDLLEWLAYSLIIGSVVGLVGTAFNQSLKAVTSFRSEHHWIIYLMPVTVIGIIFMYRKAGVLHARGTNRIIKAAKGDKEGVALRAVPLIFVGTVLSHLTGASVGREGAALQIGGAIASFTGRKIKLSHLDNRTLILCGMAAGFSSLFGAPLAAAVFAMEIVSSEIHYTAMFPVLLSSLISWTISSKLGSEGEHFIVNGAPELGIVSIAKVIIFGLLIAALSIGFIMLFHLIGDFSKKKFENQYYRAFTLGCTALLISMCFPSGEFNGAGIDVIDRALQGDAEWYAFFIKMLLSIICAVAGFRGGEIVPSFFIGATFGCVVGPLIGLDAGFAGGLGMVSFFCSVTNCPIAAMVLAYEMFGGSGLMLVALCCAVAYMMSGKYSLFEEQVFQHPKFGYEEEPDFDDYK